MAIALLTNDPVNAGLNNPAVLTGASNSSSCVMVLNVVTFGSSGFVGISGVTDNAGVSNVWHRRKRVQYVSAYSGGASGTSTHITHEVWWTNAASHPTSFSVSVALTNTGVQSDSTLLSMAAFTGSLSPSAPWDVNNPGVSTFSSGSGGTSVPSAPFSVASTGACLLGFSSSMTLGTSVFVQAGTGFTESVRTTATAGTNFNESEVQHKLNQSGSGTTSWTNAVSMWTAIADALTGTSTGTAAEAPATTPDSAGTISTNLSKVSQSASGSVTVLPTGTITTHLTKANLSLSGNVTPLSGTITTRLTAAHQLGAMTISGGPHGTITTNLTKISQQAMAPANVSGTMQTSLRGVSQRASEVETFFGTITMHLGSGSGFATGIVGSEIFTGTITTRLGPANFSLVGQEDFIGHVVTRIGGESGEAFANVVNAEEIIEGPIVMQLPPFRPLILAAQLGTPGDGKWFSYRYMDS